MKREDLGNGFCVYTDSDNKFSSDSLLLCDFAPVAESACDLCSGCGIVALRLCKKGIKRVTAVEINEAAAALIRMSAKESGADVRVINDDVKNVAKSGEHIKKYALVTANPPYYREGRSPSRRRNEIRSELLLSLRELIASASALMSENGVFCFCHLAERYDELKDSLEKAGLYISREEFVRSKPEREPYLVLIEARAIRRRCER